MVQRKAFVWSEITEPLPPKDGRTSSLEAVLPAGSVHSEPPSVAGPRLSKHSLSSIDSEAWEPADVQLERIAILLNERAATFLVYLSPWFTFLADEVRRSAAAALLDFKAGLVATLVRDRRRSFVQASCGAAIVSAAVDVARAHRLVAADGFQDLKDICQDVISRLAHFR